MSNPAASDHAYPPLDPKIGLMYAAAAQLAPFFKSGFIDASLARQMAASAIDAYLPETRADFISIARTIAFSMAALDLLGQTASQDMTMPEKMRAFGRANALNRSADQSERTMMQRRRYQQANPPAEPHNPWPELPASETDSTDAEIQAAIAEAMKDYLSLRKPTAAEAAAPEMPPEPASAASRTATPPPPVISPIDPPAPAPAIAIRYGGPGPDAGQSRTTQPRTTTYRDGLLRHSAMQRIVHPGAAPHPA